MNYNGLTEREIKTFKDLLSKANNLQIEKLTTLAVNEHKNRIMRGF